MDVHFSVVWNLLLWLGADVDQCPVVLAVRNHALALACDEVAHRARKVLPENQASSQ
jgi:hypothetical protein